MTGKSKATDGADGLMRAIEEYADCRYRERTATNATYRPIEDEARRRFDALRSSLAALPPPTGEPAAFVNAHGALTVPDGSPLAAMLKALPKAPFGEEVLPLFLAAPPQVEPAEDVADSRSGRLDLLEPSYVTSLTPGGKGIANLLTNCAQILDVVKGEWSKEGAWSEWDQSVRDDISKALAAHYAAPPAESELLSLRRKVEEQRRALEPFGREADGWADVWLDSFVPSIDTGHSCENCGHSNKDDIRAKFTVGDLRRARALGEQP